MFDCPNCGSQHLHDIIDDEWDGYHEVGGIVYNIKYGETVCSQCGWAEEFEVERHVVWDNEEG